MGTCPLRKTALAASFKVLLDIDTGAQTSANQFFMKSDATVVCREACTLVVRLLLSRPRSPACWF